MLRPSVSLTILLVCCLPGISDRGCQASGRLLWHMSELHLVWCISSCASLFIHLIFLFLSYCSELHSLCICHMKLCYTEYDHWSIKVLSTVIGNGSLRFQAEMFQILILLTGDGRNWPSDLLHVKQIRPLSHCHSSKQSVFLLHSVTLPSLLPKCWRQH